MMVVEGQLDRTNTVVAGQGMWVYMFRFRLEGMVT